MLKIPKNVRIETQPIPKEYIPEVEFLFGQYQKCLNEFFSKFGSVGYLYKVYNFTKLRNELRKHMKAFQYDLAKIYHFQGRHWVMALFHCCQNMSSCWSNLANKITHEIYKNTLLADNEKQYIYYVLNSPVHWNAILNYETVPANKVLDDLNVEGNRFHYIYNLIRRQTRLHKFKKPHADELTCMLLDENMYNIYEQDGKTYISIMGTKKGQRLVLELKSPYHYKKTGNIQLIYDKKKQVFRIHKCIETNVKPIATERRVLGVDKGYTTLLSCSDDKEYGFGFGNKLTKEAEYINQNTTAKNKLRKYVHKLEKQLAETKDVVIQKAILKKIYHIKVCNLGQDTFDKKHTKFKVKTEQTINQSIKQMVAESPAQIYGLEDLTFQNNMKPGKGKQFNRKMSFWCKGVLDKRLEYIPQLSEIQVVHVNAAYTSQYCAYCGAKLLERTGDHKEIAVCPNCGEINANTNGGKNIEYRVDDKEITLYMSPATVKSILDKRYATKNKTTKEKQDLTLITITFKMSSKKIKQLLETKIKPAKKRNK